MAIVVVGSGTKTADGTEQTLYTTGTSGHYSSTIDLSNMATNDVTAIKIYKKVLTGSSLLMIDNWTFNDAQTNKLFYIPHVSCPFGYKITLTQSAGSNRNYEWSTETA